MKANIFKVMLATVAMLTVSTISEAAINGKIYNNDVVENGKLMSREVCSEENGQMMFVSRMEMEYNVDGQISAKRDYTWNERAGQWQLQRTYEYTYTETTYSIKLTDAKGNVKNFEYSK